MPRATVGLDYEPIADQQVNSPDPDDRYLRPDVYAEVPETKPAQALEA